MSAAPLIPTDDEIRDQQACDEFHMWDEKVWRHWLWLARDLAKSPEIMRRVQDDDFANKLLHALFKGNHYSPEDVADALGQALKMPLDERISRWRALMDNVESEDVMWWLRTFMEALASVEADQPRDVAVLNG